MNSDKRLFLGMFISALFSLIAAFVLSVDALALAANSSAVLSCDINNVISCGTVANSWQAKVLGFPNSFIGMICEPVVMTIAIAGLSGVKFPRWFMFIAQCVYFVGLVFALWLFTQSAFVIGAFCPWCMLVTLGTTVTFFAMLRYNIFHDNLFVSDSLSDTLKFLCNSYVDIAISILLIISIFVIVFVKYGALLFIS